MNEFENENEEVTKKITFDQLPEAIMQIKDQLQRIELKLEQLNVGKESEDNLLTIKDAAAFINLAESTIYGKVCRMEIPVIKKNAKLYFQTKRAACLAAAR